LFAQVALTGHSRSSSAWARSGSNRGALSGQRSAGLGRACRRRRVQVFREGERRDSNRPPGSQPTGVRLSRLGADTREEAARLVEPGASWVTSYEYEGLEFSAGSREGDVVRPAGALERSGSAETNGPRERPECLSRRRSPILNDHDHAVLGHLRTNGLRGAAVTQGHATHSEGGCGVTLSRSTRRGETPRHASPPLRKCYAKRLGASRNNSERSDRKPEGNNRPHERYTTRRLRQVHRVRHTREGREVQVKGSPRWAHSCLRHLAAGRCRGWPVGWIGADLDPGERRWGSLGCA
jgi:hypothetical protein